MKSRILAFIAIAAMSGIGSASAETWECEIDGTTKKVILSQDSDPALSNDKYVSGVVTGPYGKKYSAKVSIDGFDRRWDYTKADKTVAYAIVISPSGQAKFYDLRKLMPRYYLLCRESKTKAKLQTEEKSETKLPAKGNQPRLNSLREAYILAIRQKVERNWRKPLGSGKMPICEVHVVQGPGGVILDVTFGACGGSTAAYRASIESAVYKAEPLPKPGDPAFFERELTFLFNPEQQ